MAKYVHVPTILKIKFRIEVDKVSMRQQPDHRTDNKSFLYVFLLIRNNYLVTLPTKDYTPN